MKALHPITSFVLVVAILTTALLITWLTLEPVFRRAREGSIVREAMNNLRMLDLVLKEVVAEGIGASRRIPLRISEGRYVIDQAVDRIEFRLRTEIGTLEPGLYVEEGNLRLVTGWTASAESNGTHFLLENQALRLVLRNATSLFGFIAGIESKLTNQTLNLTNSSFVFDANPTLSTQAKASLLTEGKRLAKAVVEFETAGRRARFVLSAVSDYLEVWVSNATNFTLGLEFKHGSEVEDDYVLIPGVYGANISNLTAGACDYDEACELYQGETPACGDCNCWDERHLLAFWICSHDETEFSPPMSTSLTHLGLKPNFLGLCFSNLSQGYRLNLTSTRRLALGFTMHDCQSIGRAMEFDEYEQWLPPAIAIVPLLEVEEYDILIYLEYERFDLTKGGVLRPGTPYVCVRYAGVGLKPRVEVWPC